MIHFSQSSTYPTLTCCCCCCCWTHLANTRMGLRDREIERAEIERDERRERLGKDERG